MPRFAANLSLMYTEHAFLDRFGAAAADGFRAVEYLFPYAFERAEIAARLADHGLQQSAVQRSARRVPAARRHHRRARRVRALPTFLNQESSP